MKIDTFHQIQLGSVYRGLSPVPNDEIYRLYNGLYIPRKFIRGDNYEVSFECILHLQCIIFLIQG